MQCKDVIYRYSSIMMNFTSLLPLIFQFKLWRETPTMSSSIGPNISTNTFQHSLYPTLLYWVLLILFVAAFNDMQRCPFSYYITTSTFIFGGYRGKCHFADSAQKSSSTAIKVYSMLSTVHKHSSQKGQDHIIDYEILFLASDATLPPQPAEVTTCTPSSLDAVIVEVAGFLDTLVIKQVSLWRIN